MTAPTDGPTEGPGDEAGDRAAPPVPPPAAVPPPWRLAEWRRLDPDGDLDVLHRWMHARHVARYWRLAVPRPELASYLQAAVANPHQDVLLGLLDGRPASYWEAYWAQHDRLAEFWPIEPYDQGVHLLIGPTVLIGRGLGRYLLAAVTRWQFAREPRTKRLLAEPEAGNERSIRLFESCGFRRERDLALPEKRATLMVRYREPPLMTEPLA
jgi:RimJ/RimL family protein N-acetyltransferase